MPPARQNRPQRGKGSTQGGARSKLNSSQIFNVNVNQTTGLETQSTTKHGSEPEATLTSKSDKVKRDPSWTESENLAVLEVCIAFKSHFHGPPDEDSPVLDKFWSKVFTEICKQKLVKVSSRSDLKSRLKTVCRIRLQQLKTGETPVPVRRVERLIDEFNTITLQRETRDFVDELRSIDGALWQALGRKAIVELPAQILNAGPQLLITQAMISNESLSVAERWQLAHSWRSKVAMISVLADPDFAFAKASSKGADIIGKGKEHALKNYQGASRTQLYGDTTDDDADNDASKLEPRSDQDNKRTEGPASMGKRKRETGDDQHNLTGGRKRKIAHKMEEGHEASLASSDQPYDNDGNETQSDEEDQDQEREKEHERAGKKQGGEKKKGKQAGKARQRAERKRRRQEEKDLERKREQEVRDQFEKERQETTDRERKEMTRLEEAQKAKWEDMFTELEVQRDKIERKWRELENNQRAFENEMLRREEQSAAAARELQRQMEERTANGQHRWSEQQPQMLRAHDSMAGVSGLPLHPGHPGHLGQLGQLYNRQPQMQQW